jgi:hypothetical protein
MVFLHRRCLKELKRLVNRPQPRPQTVPRPTPQPEPQRVTVSLSRAFPQLRNWLSNPGFEDGSVGEAPPQGWQFGAIGAYFSQTTGDSCYSGKQCAMVQSRTLYTPGSHAFLFQILPALPFRDKQFTFRAAVRAEVAGPDGARLVIRIHREDRSSCFFDNMEDRPITSRQWTFYEITGHVCSDARDLEVGMQLLGRRQRMDG